MKVKIRFCKDCGEQENLNHAPINDIECRKCGGGFKLREIDKSDVIVDVKEIIKNFNQRCESNYRLLNSWSWR